MQISMLRAKIHRAKVSDARLDYIGSITIDKALLELSGILEYEKLEIVNLNNGARFETYAIAGGAGEICLNGAAARLVSKNDLIIIMAYANLNFEEAKNFKPKVVFVNENNEPIRVAHYEKAGALFDEI